MKMTTEKVSPFATYAAEELVRYIPEAPRSLFLTDLDKMILIVLNKYQVLTSALMVSALRNLGLENFNQSDIQNRLRLMSDAAFTVRSEFRSATGRSANKVYTLGYRGRGWLKANGKRVALAGYIDNLDVSDVKRLLSVNQYLIRTNKDFESVAVCQPVFVTDSNGQKKDDMIFRAFGFVTTETNDVIVESVRRSENWKVDLENKMARIEKVVKSKRATNLSRTLKTPTIILICEDDCHMSECMGILSRSNLNLHFCHDLGVYSDANNCLKRAKKEDTKESLFYLLFGIKPKKQIAC